MRRFWFISCSHFLLHLSRSCFAVDLTQLLPPRGKEEEGGLQACAGAASPGGLLRLCISVLLLPRGTVPQPAQAAGLPRPGKNGYPFSAQPESPCVSPSSAEVCFISSGRDEASSH